MARLFLFAIIIVVAVIIWIVKALAGTVSGSERFRQETLRTQTQKTMQTTARGVNWLNEQWEQAKLAARGDAATQLALKIEENLIALENAANQGDWEQASVYSEHQDPLLALYLRCDSSSEEHLLGILRKNNQIRSLRDPEYQDWISDELLKRGLLPIGMKLD